MSNIHNKEAYYYKVELYNVKPWLRSAFKEIPMKLADRIILFNGGRTIRTDLDALWQFVRPEELRTNRSLVRLEHDLRWRFSHILCVDSVMEPPVYPLGVRDYLLRTYLEPCTVKEREELDAQHRFDAMCRVAAERAVSKETCAKYLSTRADEAANMMKGIAIGDRTIIDFHVSLELAMLECALGAMKAAYGLDDEVAMHRERLMESVGDYLAGVRDPDSKEEGTHE